MSDWYKKRWLGWDRSLQPGDLLQVDNWQGYFEIVKVERTFIDQDDIDGKRPYWNNRLRPRQWAIKRLNLGVGDEVTPKLTVKMVISKKFKKSKGKNRLVLASETKITKLDLTSLGRIRDEEIQAVENRCKALSDFILKQQPNVVAVNP